MANGLIVLSAIGMSARFLSIRRKGEYRMDRLTAFLGAAAVASFVVGQIVARKSSNWYIGENI